MWPVAGVRIVRPYRFEQDEIGPAVAVEIGNRRLHALDRARLPGEIDDHVLIDERCGNRRRIAQVTFDNSRASPGQGSRQVRMRRQRP